jgi:hypothetical protein
VRRRSAASLSSFMVSVHNDRTIVQAAPSQSEGHSPFNTLSPSVSESGPSPIVSTLFVATLEADNVISPPPCTALSYSWGDDGELSIEPIRDKEQIVISCNGSHYRIPSNLFAALGRLQPRDEVLTIRIDFLCINQDDVDERNKQVAIMGEIFSQSSEVIMWLEKTPLQHADDRLWSQQYRW